MTRLDEFYGKNLKASDVTEEKEVEVEKVVVETFGREEDTERKPVVYFKGVDKGLPLNKGNAESLAELSGSREIEDWVGVKCVLFVDPEVKYRGEKVGGLRLKVVPKKEGD